MMGRLDWEPLRRELAKWRARGLTLPIWWRDDDAISPTPQLTQLAELASAIGMPVHLAIIPAFAQLGLVPYLNLNGVFRAIVHGWRHENLAVTGERPSEFGNYRVGGTPDVSQGLDRMKVLFGEAALPVFVPPWNRISVGFFPDLLGAGYRALSQFGPRTRRQAFHELVQINTHIDPIDWHSSAGLIDPATIISGLTSHLADRRSGRADAAEPLGLLTHHLVQDEATWAFCTALLKELMSGPCSPIDLAVSTPIPSLSQS